ncbi:hypothetical protein ACJ41O_013644 [Fusarium nematophilum]
MAFKRKSTSSLLGRRVRPRREDDWQEDPESQASSSEEDDDDDDEVEEEGIRGHDEDDDDDEEGSESEDGSDVESESDQDQEPAGSKVDLSSISFGALAKAQSSLPSSGRKSKSKSSAETRTDDTPARPRKPTTRSRDDPKLKRSSKHAPQEQSSKRPVSRRREILPDNRRQYRDPRFDPLVGGARVDEDKASRAYAFLDEYRDKEMADLRAQIKKTKDAGVKDDLKRQLQSMESRRKARKRREEEDSLLREHRRREKELVAQGKTPFYLKKSEQKKQLLVDRYEGMSKGQVDRAIERKRKKVAGKEKKELDSLQRVRPRG